MIRSLNSRISDNLKIADKLISKIVNDYDSDSNVRQHKIDGKILDFSNRDFSVIFKNYSNESLGVPNNSSAYNNALKEVKLLLAGKLSIPKLLQKTEESIEKIAEIELNRFINFKKSHSNSNQLSIIHKSIIQDRISIAKHKIELELCESKSINYKKESDVLSQMSLYTKMNQKSLESPSIKKILNQASEIAAAFDSPVQSLINEKFSNLNSILDLELKEFQPNKVQSTASDDNNKKQDNPNYLLDRPKNENNSLIHPIVKGRRSGNAGIDNSKNKPGKILDNNSGDHPDDNPQGPRKSM